MNAWRKSFTEHQLSGFKTEHQQPFCVWLCMYLCLLWSTNMRALSNVIQPTTIDRCTNPLPPLLKLDPQNLCFGDTYYLPSMYQQRSRLWKEREWQRQWWWWWDPGGVNIWAIFSDYSTYTLTHTCSVCKVCSKK